MNEVKGPGFEPDLTVVFPADSVADEVGGRSLSDLAFFLLDHYGKVRKKEFDLVGIKGKAVVLMGWLDYRGPIHTAKLRRPMVVDFNRLEVFKEMGPGQKKSVEEAIEFAESVEGTNILISVINLVDGKSIFTCEPFSKSPGPEAAAPSK